MEAVNCQRCTSENVVTLQLVPKSSVPMTFSCKDKSLSTHLIPKTVEDFGVANFVDFAICFDCNTLQGTFPKSISFLEQSNSEDEHSSDDYYPNLAYTCVCGSSSMDFCGVCNECGRPEWA